MVGGKKVGRDDDYDNDNDNGVPMLQFILSISISKLVSISMPPSIWTVTSNHNTAIHFPVFPCRSLCDSMLLSLLGCVCVMCVYLYSPLSLPTENCLDSFSFRNGFVYQFSFDFIVEFFVLFYRSLFPIEYVHKAHTIRFA